jgi:hypothetical protein
MSAPLALPTAAALRPDQGEIVVFGEVAEVFDVEGR